MYGGEPDSVRHASQETSIGAEEDNRRMPTDWKRTARRMRAEQGGTAKQRRRSSSVVANNDVIAETNARLPM